MITSKMNASEIAKIRIKDNERIKAFQVNKAAELRRQLGKTGAKRISTCVDFKTPNAEYKISFNVYSGGDNFFSGVFAYLREDNVYIAMSTPVKDKEYYMAMSPHFFNRYAERHLKKKMTISKAMSFFFYDFMGAIGIYGDEDGKFVYAIDSGIMLGIFDFDRQILFIKTFVSLDMLKESQLKSFEKVKANLDEARRRVMESRKSDDNEKVNWEFDKAYKDLLSVDATEARDIYATFFEEGGADD